MLRSLPHGSDALNPQNIQHSLQTLLAPIWQNTRRGRIGLAISGGVDSMALATICHSLKAPKNTFQAFVVDHKLRPGSQDEAQAVVRELERLEIPAEILELEWTTQDRHVARWHIEKLARRLRYQTIGRACYKHNIGNLLVAHHADDQAETVLMRILDQKLGTGLKGIQTCANIPECEGIYGVDASGSPGPLSRRLMIGFQKYRMIVENGGVKVLRPLLSLKKEDLVSLCKTAGTKWYEDHTNADRKLTKRNTVRYFHKADLLPCALKPSKLLDIATRLKSKYQQSETDAQRLFDDTDIKFDPISGIASVIPPELKSADLKSHSAKAGMIRKVLSLVSPMKEIALQNLDSAVKFVFDPNAKEGNKLHIAHVLLEWVSTGRYLVLRLHRAIPQAFTNSIATIPDVGSMLKLDLKLQSSAGTATSTTISWTKWHLWDRRYWIRMGWQGNARAPSGVSYSVRFLTGDRLSALRKSVNVQEVESLRQALWQAQGKPRFTLPAIFLEQPGHEQIVALPSLFWCRDNYRFSPDDDGGDANYPILDIRYRAGPLNQSEKHKITSVESVQPRSLQSSGVSGNDFVSQLRDLSNDGQERQVHHMPFFESEDDEERRIIESIKQQQLSGVYEAAQDIY